MNRSGISLDTLQRAGIEEIDPVSAGRRASIFDAWRALGLPGVPGWATPSPFGGSGHLAFMVLPDARTWIDFEYRDRGGSSRFLQLVLGGDISVGEAKWLAQELDADVAEDHAATQAARCDQTGGTAQSAPAPAEGGVTPCAPAPAESTGIGLIERARRYVAKMPPAIQGHNGDKATYLVALALVHGFGLTVEAATPLIREYNNRCRPRWADKDLVRKLRSATTAKCQKPRGHLAGGVSAAAAEEVSSVPETEDSESPALTEISFEAEELARVAAPLVGVVDDQFLADRSIIDPANVTTEQFLAHLYPDHEKVVVLPTMASPGLLWPGTALPATGCEGVLFLPQPVDGEQRVNDHGNLSRRSWQNVTDFRYIVLESDAADTVQWLAFLAQLPLPIVSMVTSGNRSIHALVRVNSRTKEDWDRQKESMMPFFRYFARVGGDPRTLSAVRTTRLPGCYREGKQDDGGRYVRFPTPRLQQLLYLRPDADGTPICQLPALRGPTASGSAAS